MWIAEQKAEAEDKKLAELKKQIAEERQLQELKELQVKAGLVDQSQLEKLDWMYEGPMATMQDHQSNTEQYLLGKEVEVKAADSEVKKVESQPGMLFLNSVSAKNDLFTRLHEDPLLLIKQNELRVRACLRASKPAGLRACRDCRAMFDSLRRWPADPSLFPPFGRNGKTSSRTPSRWRASGSSSRPTSRCAR